MWIRISCIIVFSLSFARAVGIEFRTHCTWSVYHHWLGIDAKNQRVRGIVCKYEWNKLINGARGIDLHTTAIESVVCMGTRENASVRPAHEPIAVCSCMCVPFTDTRFGLWTSHRMWLYLCNVRVVIVDRRSQSTRIGVWLCNLAPSRQSRSWHARKHNAISFLIYIFSQWRHLNA